MSVRFSLRRNNKAPAPGSPDDTSADAGRSGTSGEYKGALRYRVRSETNTSGANASGNAQELNRAYDHTHEVHPVGYSAAGVDEGATEGGYVGAPELYGPDPTIIAEPVYEPEAYVGDYEDDESWLAPDTRRRIKLAIPTFALGALVVIAGAFWGGAEVDKHFGAHNTTSAGSLAAALGGRGATGSGGTGRGGFSGLGGGGFAGGGGGGFGATPAASGTLSAISGDDLTVKTTTGKVMKVVLTRSTLVTRIGQGSPGGLKVGDTIRVQGTAGSGGTVTASSITAIAAGVTTGGGFAGGGLGSGLGGSGAGGAGTGVGGGSAAGSPTQTTVKNGGFSGDGSGVSGG